MYAPSMLAGKEIIAEWCPTFLESFTSERFTCAFDLANDVACKTALETALHHLSPIYNRRLPCARLWPTIQEGRHRAVE